MKKKTMKDIRIWGVLLLAVAALVACSSDDENDSVAELPQAPTAQVYGVFTVNNSGKKVKFASGNLQYNSREVTYKWRFAENQYDYVGAWDTSTWVDLFGWGTWTGSSPNPLNTSTTNSQYSWNNADFIQESLLADANMRSYNWRMLTIAEWGHLFNTRSASTVNGTANARYAKANVNNVQGLIIFPDSYTHPAGVTLPTGVNVTGETGRNGNSYDVSAWAKMEAAGCVFLPTAGSRQWTSVSNDGLYGYYWSSTPSGSNCAYYVGFYSGNLNPTYDGNRYNGFSVRLVCEVE